MNVTPKIEIRDLLTADLHLHTVYCDGRNTPEEMVVSAIDKGFACIGFSGQSYVEFDPGCGMDANALEAYRKEIQTLKETYKDRIRIFCGIELDSYSDMPEGEFDYVIGSVHYLDGTPRPAAVDDTPEELMEAVQREYGNDYYLAAEHYYAAVSDIVSKTGCDIIGHFDLIAKFNEKYRLFDEQHPRYKKAWTEALDRLLPQGKIFEINTGAVSRGWRSTPYPAPEMIDYIRQRGGRFLLSSDSHGCETIGYGFREAAENAGLF